jgi:ectoine hydroxylase-related dioxygenase (phytanoyl-CoA dioxygenase family)
VPKRLTEDQVETFASEGYVSPLDGIGGDEALNCLDRLDAYEEATGNAMSERLRLKAHLAFPWMIALAGDARILDAVEDLIGPDILLYISSVWAKKPGDQRYVSWHQDSAYYGLRPHDAVSVWLALTPSTTDCGSVKVIPGSHIGAPREHLETWDDMNMLWRGQAIRGMDIGRAVDMQLAPGQFSIHHEKLVHGSLPNDSPNRRIGISFTYVPARVRSVTGRGAAILLRGRDPFDHWDADPAPRFDLDPVGVGAMHRALVAYRDPARAPEGGRGVMTSMERRALRAHLLHRSPPAR